MQSADNAYIFMFLRDYSNLLESDKVYSRSLSFENVVLGDLAIQYVHPPFLDERKLTYVKTFLQGSLKRALDFITRTKFVNTKRLVLHFGNYDIKSGLTSKEIFLQMKATIIAARIQIPNCQIFVSLPIPWCARYGLNEPSLNLLEELMKLNAEQYGVKIITNMDVLRNKDTCIDGSRYFSRRGGTRLFMNQLKELLEITDGSEVPAS